ncbi:hypothetical protein LOZ66_006303 [Ophidiomyces ophidiicola]|nr:hypothetical protein LOZ66_006303 [Ophidiomyces ophidiicola]
MSAPRVEIGVEGDNDVQMTGANEAPIEARSTDATEEAVDSAPPEDAESTEPPAESSQEHKFLNYLKSPIIELAIGRGDERTVLTAHQAILTTSPFFAAEVSKLPENGPRRIILEDQSLDAMACFLQFQYTGEYFPKRLGSPAEGLETDPSIPEVDESGEQLLKHARVYTLAEKLGLESLKLLAHGKIHRINSTAKGEISYARYVYTNTASSDATIRKPVAAFWATRSHVLRHDAEADFRSLCLEHPQFGFDVLSLVLDQREKRAHDREMDSPAVKGSARKRTRMG